jgi:hypothetical protein
MPSVHVLLPNFSHLDKAGSIYKRIDLYDNGRVDIGWALFIWWHSRSTGRVVIMPLLRLMLVRSVAYPKAVRSARNQSVWNMAQPV